MWQRNKGDRSTRHTSVEPQPQVTQVNNGVNIDAKQLRVHIRSNNRDPIASPNCQIQGTPVTLVVTPPIHASQIATRTGQVHCFPYHSLHPHNAHARFKLSHFYHHVHYCLVIAFQNLCHVCTCMRNTTRGWNTTHHAQNDTFLTLNLMLWVPLSSPSQCSCHLQASLFLSAHTQLSCNRLSNHMLQSS